MSLKIAFLLDKVDKLNAGTEIQVAVLMDLLTKKNIKLDITCLRKSSGLKEKFKQTRVLEINRIFTPFALFKIIKLASFYKKENFKIVHIFFNDAAILAPVIFYFFGIKTIVSRRDLGFWQTKFHKILLPFIAKFVDIFLANGKSVAKNISKNEKVSSKKIKIIHNIFLKNEQKSISQLNFFKNKIPKNSFVFAKIANIKPLKNQKDALLAFANIHKLYKNITLLFIGNGNSKNLEKLAQKLKVNKKVFFLKNQKTTKNLLDKIDVGLLCSKTEGFSNSLIEYLAAKKICICSKVGGNIEIIKHKKNGLLYLANDQKELAKLMHLVITNKKLTRKLKANAKKSLGSKFRKKYVLRKYIKLYESLLIN